MTELSIAVGERGAITAASLIEDFLDDPSLLSSGSMFDLVGSMLTYLGSFNMSYAVTGRARLEEVDVLFATEIPADDGSTPLI